MHVEGSNGRQRAERDADGMHKSYDEGALLAGVVCALTAIVLKIGSWAVRRHRAAPVPPWPMQV